MDYEYRQLRWTAIVKYGGKCSRCGFADWRALQFDHVKGGGRSDPNGYRSTSSITYMKYVLNALFGEFQLLCANCNVIKRCENSEGASKNLNEKHLARMKKFQETGT